MLVTTHVETVVLLSQRKADDYLEVEIDLDELDATSAETKATYEQPSPHVSYAQTDPQPGHVSPHTRLPPAP